jgi:hypothetical protein
VKAIAGVVSLLAGSPVAYLLIRAWLDHKRRTLRRSRPGHRPTFTHPDHDPRSCGEQHEPFTQARAAYHFEEGRTEALSWRNGAPIGYTNEQRRPCCPLCFYRPLLAVAASQSHGEWPLRAEEYRHHLAGVESVIPRCACPPPTH